MSCSNYDDWYDDIWLANDYWRKGFFVEIPELFVEGLVHVSTLNNDWYEYRSRQNLLIGRKSKKSYKTGDLINIKIIKVDILKYQIDLELVEK